MTIRIVPLEPSDWETVQSIYSEGIQTGQATFETQAPTWEAWNSSHLPFARLLAKFDDGSSQGWAALSPVSTRSVYGGVAEVSVYVAKDARGRGIGRVLLDTIIQVAEENGIWTLQSSMFPENEASLSLHQACGFRVVGNRERIGRLHGVWRDTLLMERRSDRVGID